MRFLHRFNVFLFLLILPLMTACRHYEELTIANKLILDEISSEFKFSDTVIVTKPGVKLSQKKSLLISSKKYLARGSGCNPESMIMNTGIEEILKGNYIEAEILLKQILENITDGSVENNLAVVYELTRRKKDSLKMYETSLIKSPDNSRFRSNLLSFINHNKFGQVSK